MNLDSMTVRVTTAAVDDVMIGNNVTVTVNADLVIWIHSAQRNCTDHL